MFYLVPSSFMKIYRLLQMKTILVWEYNNTLFIYFRILSAITRIASFDIVAWTLRQKRTKTAKQDKTKQIKNEKRM